MLSKAQKQQLNKPYVEIFPSSAVTLLVDGAEWMQAAGPELQVWLQSWLGLVCDALHKWHSMSLFPLTHIKQWLRLWDSPRFRLYSSCALSNIAIVDSQSPLKLKISQRLCVHKDIPTELLSVILQRKKNSD